MRTRFFAAVALVAAISPLPGADGGPVKTEDAVRGVLAAYATAWSGGDARAIAELYTTDADDAGMDGEMTRGRDAIARRYESLLTGELAGSELTIEMRSLRLLKPDVALLDGELQLTRAGRTAAERPQFMAIMVSDGTHWQITSLWMQSRSARQ